jgi:protein gp37
MNKTSIEWTHRPGTVGMTWNPIRARFRDDAGNILKGWACTHASPGCLHCYAETINKRFGTGLPFSVPALSRVEFYLDEKILQEPPKAKKPCTIFVGDMFDLFHEAIPDSMILAVFDVMRISSNHVFQMLTKRTERMSRFGVLADYTMSHVWPGTSVEDEKRAAERIPYLCRTRTLGKRFLSVEPMLEPVELRSKTNCADAESPLGCIDWVICGGESGPHARPFNLSWAESLREQCKAAGVPFFMKQVGSNPRIWSDVVKSEIKWLACKDDRKGGDPTKWPPNLRVREFPA